MRLWRLLRKAFATEPLNGSGGLHASGRWHTKSRRVVYASESLALAALELLVHLDVDLSPPDLVAVEIDVPPRMRITHWPASDLPRNWRKYPAPKSLQMLGNTWLDARETAVLCVPSVIVPSENNYLLNPMHAASARIKVVAKRPFAFDRRLIDE